jgi:hypothetical protein
MACLVGASVLIDAMLIDAMLIDPMLTDPMPIAMERNGGLPGPCNDLEHLVAVRTPLA